MLAMGAAAVVVSLGAPPPEPARLAVAPVCYGGTLSLDRQDVGHLPLAELAVAPGFHLVEVRCPGRPRWSTLVFAAPGGRVALSPEIAPAAERSLDPSRPGAEPPPPRVAISGRATLRGEEADGTASVDHAWSLGFTPAEPEGWRADALVDARHGLVGRPAGTDWHLRELQLTTPAWDGTRAAGGRFQRTLPGLEPASTDGARLLWRGEAWDLSAALGRRAGPDVAAVSGAAGYAADGFAARLLAERAEATRASLSLGGVGGEAFTFTLQGTTEGRDAAWALGELSTRLGASGVTVRGRWRALDAEPAGPFLAPAEGLLADTAGSLATMSVYVGVDEARLRADLDAGAPGLHARLRASAATAGLAWEVGAARLEGRHGLPDLSRVRAETRWRPASRWRLEAGAGPERVRWPDLPPEAFLTADAAAAVGLADDVWLRLEGGLHATDRRAAPAAPPRAGTLALHLEVW